MDVSEFKYRQLSKIVMDEPWDTALMWSDAESELASLEPCERDLALQRLIIDLSAEGLAYFYPFDSYRRGYDDVPPPTAVLRGDELQRRVGPERTSPVPQLAIRPTPAGRERHFQMYPQDRSRWERSTRRS